MIIKLFLCFIFNFKDFIYIYMILNGFYEGYFNLMKDS